MVASRLDPRPITVTVTVAAAGNYSAGDVVSNSATADAGVANRVPNAVVDNGKVAVLDAVRVVSSEDSVVWRLRLHWYNYEPAAADVEMDDNVAKDLAKIATGATGYLGYTDVSAMIDAGTAMAFAQATNLRQELPTHRNNAKDLWFVIETLDDEANEAAGQTLRFDFTFLN